MHLIIIAVVIVSVIGLIAGLGLAVASKVMAVPVDEKAEEIQAALPGANCGACGFSGCSGYAAALSQGKTTDTGRCMPGGAEVSKAIAKITGLAAHGAARLFAGDAKTDERDAMVIAKTALGIPDALLPVGDPGPTIAAARALAAQRNFLTCENTRNKNRLRSILLESCPAFEALVDLSDGPQLRLMASLGGAWSVADAGPRRAAALTRGAARGKIEALVRSTTSSTRPDASVVAAEDRAVKLLARRISENSAEIEAITAEISALLEGDDTYRCLLTVPGIGPKTASELAISIDIEDFPSHDRLASYCGLAPRNRQSGTSISSVTASRQGNKRLKNLLIFSCNCLTRTEGRWGDYYTRCRERGMSHGKALKALARKRLKVIYAVMRDRVPYAA